MVLFSENSELVSDCARGDLKEVKKRLRKGADIHFMQDDPLHTACKNGHLEVVKYLLKKGADIHAFRDHALKMACQFGHYDIVKFLVDKGANVNSTIVDYAKHNSTRCIQEYLKAELKKRQAEVDESDESESEDAESVSESEPGLEDPPKKYSVNGVRIDVSPELATLLDKKMKEGVLKKRSYKCPPNNALTFDGFVTSMYVCRDEVEPGQHCSKRVRILVHDIERDDLRKFDAEF